MGFKKRDEVLAKKEVQTIDTVKLIDLANDYVAHCLNSTKQYPTARGAVEVKERHLPTVSYFLLIWLRLNNFDFYKRVHWYEVSKNEEHPYHKVVKEIDSMFRALATDIVANEGKGIFYAKNYLGMTDKVQTESTGVSEIKITYDNRD